MGRKTCGSAWYVRCFPGMAQPVYHRLPPVRRRAHPWCGGGRHRRHTRGARGARGSGGGPLWARGRRAAIVGREALEGALISSSSPVKTDLKDTLPHRRELTGLRRVDQPHRALESKARELWRECQVFVSGWRQQAGYTWGERARAITQYCETQPWGRCDACGTLGGTKDPIRFLQIPRDPSSSHPLRLDTRPRERSPGRHSQAFKLSQSDLKYPCFLYFAFFLY